MVVLFGSVLSISQGLSMYRGVRTLKGLSVDTGKDPFSENSESDIVVPGHFQGHRGLFVWFGFIIVFKSFLILQ